MHRSICSRSWRRPPTVVPWLVAGWLGAAAAVPASVAAADASAAVATLRAVGPEGTGNAAAAAAWRSLAALDAAAIPELLAGLDGANPYAANWLRTVVDTIAARSETLPIDALAAYLLDTDHDPRGRRLAWELIRQRDEARAETLIAGMLDDPSVELRRDAVQRVIDAAAARTAAQDPAAVAEYRWALDAARDVEQIKTITKALEKAGETVDLPRHFGFLTHWQVIGPFDNTGEAGFAAVYPPEEAPGAAPDAAATWAGKGDATVRWKPFSTADTYGVVDINAAYPGPDDGLKEVVAYAVADFESDADRDAEIRLGCKNAWKIWHNGRLVFGRDEYHRGMRIDQYRLPIRLTKGPNRFLVKICQDGQTKDWTKQWEFQFRVCDAAGTAILALDRPPTPTAAEAAAP
jgi:hypothetical protein